MMRPLDARYCAVRTLNAAVLQLIKLRWVTSVSFDLVGGPGGRKTQKLVEEKPNM